MDIKQTYNEWLENAVEDKDLTAELESIKNNEDEIYDRFYTALKFGTAGLRGIIGAGTNRMNIYVVRQATQGLANYVLKKYGNGSVAISHDSRIKADLFMNEAARVLAANGIKVYITSELQPTPVLSYLVRYFKCQAGIMVTASHNPAAYNGYKAYGEDGCQMTDVAANTVYDEISKLDMFKDVKITDFDEAVKSGMIEYVDESVYDTYLEKVMEQQVNPGVCKGADLKVVYTPLNGTGNKLVRKVLGKIGVNDVVVVPEQELPDGNFTTCPYPNPEIKEALETVRNRIAALISSDSGVTATGNPWYVQTHVQENPDQEQTIQELSEAYPGTLPQLLYDINISYTDIRTGEGYQPMTMISLTFPVPDGYESLTKPRVLRSTGDSFMELTPQTTEDNRFYLDSARTLNHLIIADFPAGLQGISLNSKSVKINRGQKYTLKVVPIPESVTEEYTVTWKSSDTSVAKVSKKGVVTAVKNGKATITASVTQHPEMTASCKVTVMQGANALKKSVSQVMAETSAYMRATDTNPSVGSEWYVLGLARGGLSLKEKYFSTYYNHTANYIEEKKGILTNTSKYTEYSKRILVLTSEGKDARNVGGYNLFQYISDFSLVKEQGLNGPIWALLALNCHPEYSFPENPSAKEQRPHLP